MIRVLLGLIVLAVSHGVIAYVKTAVPVITMERTACFGPCPIYTLTIFDDGKVVYEGRDFVKKKGRAESKITKQQLADLIAEFTKIDYFNLKSNPDCLEQWTDHPSAITSLSWEGKNQTIQHDHGCRGSHILEDLTKLEDKIDEAVNAAQWIR